MSYIHEAFEVVRRSCSQAVTRFDEKYGIAWIYMNPRPRPCMTPKMLEEGRRIQQVWEKVNRVALEQGEEQPIRYVVAASLVPDVFNYGGDLALFLEYLKARDREGLRDYAYMCVEHVYLMSVGLNQPIVTIALVQGDALGGGFELALCCNVLIAEKSAQFGFPEILFNLFPGMGAYSFLTRKVGMAKAEKIITSGKLFTAQEMYEAGVVDVLAEDGEGEKALYDYISLHAKRRNAYQALLRVRNRVNPVTREELLEVADIWVDAAMKIGSRELKLMERLVRAQNKLLEEPGKAVVMLKTGRQA